MYSPDRIAPSGLELRRLRTARVAAVLWPGDHSALYPDSGTSQVQILQADPGEQTLLRRANPPTMAEKKSQSTGFFLLVPEASSIISSL